MRTRLGTVVAAAALLAGCAAHAGPPPPAAGFVGVSAAEAPASDRGSAPTSAAEQPTEDAGGELSRAEGTATAEGACHLLDVALVAEVIGIRFDIAAASRQGATYTCLLRPLANPHPELALSITATTIDATILREEVAPRGARAVKGLGKAGYQATVAGSGAQRPAVEVGWLSGDQRLISLRYTVADGEDPAELAPRLLTLARRIDAYRTE